MVWKGLKWFEKLQDCLKSDEIIWKAISGSNKVKGLPHDFYQALRPEAHGLLVVGVFQICLSYSER